MFLKTFLLRDWQPPCPSVVQGEERKTKLQEKSSSRECQIVWLLRVTFGKASSKGSDCQCDSH